MSEHGAASCCSRRLTAQRRPLALAWKHTFYSLKTHTCTSWSHNTRPCVSVAAAVLRLLQGRLGAALRYLEMVPGEASTSVAVLKDRIYRCVCVC